MASWAIADGADEKSGPVPEVMPSPAPLISRRLDAWAVGWLAVVVWIALVVADGSGRQVPVADWLIWTAGAIGAAHFAMSYRLAYDGGVPALRRHPLALVVGPMLLAAFVGVGVVGQHVGWLGSADLLRSSVVIVYLLTMWHYVKQTFGVVRLGARLRGFSLTASEAAAIRYGMYPLWGLSIMAAASRRSIVDVEGFELRADLIPAVGVDVRALVVVLTAVWLIVTVARAAMRQHRRPPGIVVAPLVAAVMWVGWTPSLLAGVVALPAFHAIQYLACCGPAQHGLLGHPAPATPHQRWQVAQVLVAAACAGLLVTEYLPPVLERWWSAPPGGARWLLALFVFLNLHHYLIDATIWRSGGPVVRSIGARHASQERSPRDT